MAVEPVSIQRQSDGRHHVMDAEGKVLGKHNSPWSAARQMHEYFAKENLEARNVGGKQGSIMEHPNIPQPPKSRPGIPTPKIPRP